MNSRPDDLNFLIHCTRITPATAAFLKLWMKLTRFPFILILKLYCPFSEIPFNKQTIVNLFWRLNCSAARMSKMCIVSFSVRAVYFLLASRLLSFSPLSHSLYFLIFQFLSARSITKSYTWTSEIRGSHYASNAQKQKLECERSCVGVYIKRKQLTIVWHMSIPLLYLILTSQRFDSSRTEMSK